MTLEPIGYVESCFRDKFGTPRQPGLVVNSRAKINVLPQWQPEISLQGLEGFSHLWVIFHFHQNTNDRFHAKVHPPRMGGASIGVFASRSPHRPNPLGLSVVEVEKLETDGVWVKGLDVVNGTPVLDLKPYLPSVESYPQAREGWAATAPQRQHKIQWLESALAALQIGFDQSSQEFKAHSVFELKTLIEETLSLDPRPLVYRQSAQEGQKYRDQHAVRLYDFDIHFRWVDSQTIEILKVIV